MTFGRPPCIRNEYLQCDPILEVDLERLESASASLAELETPDFTSTVACFGQSMQVIQRETLTLR